MRETGPLDPFPCPDRSFEGYIFGLGVTILPGDDLLPGAKRLIEKPRERGKRIVFLPNDVAMDPKMHARRLTTLGLRTPENEVSNTCVTMTRWHLQYQPEATVFTNSEGPLERPPRMAGIGVSEIVRDRMRMSPSTSPSCQ